MMAIHWLPDAGRYRVTDGAVAFAFYNITVMTNSLHIVNALSELDNEQTILMPGGTFRKNRRRFTVNWRKAPLSNSAFDKLFMGTDGIDLNVGVTTFQ